MYPNHTGRAPTKGAVTVHQPAPVTVIPGVPLAPVQPSTVAAVQSIVLPDGRIVTGYAIDAAKPEPLAAKPAISRTAVNIALGGIGFGAICGGLLLLTTFIAALAALVQQLIILAAVIFGGWIAIQIFGGGSRGGITVNARKAVIKRNHFHG
ncbi:hypothetical protein DEJ49_20115 [Streptomyces venezuelae]|uniref:Uncharacterized protein n=1 Tax=Streptomyces venezuelae TaxID=54571 RepID=A0A5P2CLJ3_STRVZ|nr:hypothetical protein [Streptomyces venezuelae]QES42977.1 hypothetical protein DEJ49_20115 [Streptomyces venezuelae]